jgi:hypothetical protein
MALASEPGATAGLAEVEAAIKAVIRERRKEWELKA